MKKIILASVIFVALVFSSEKSFAQSGTESKSDFSPGCYGYFSIGTNHFVYRYHDDGSSSVTINIDTTYDYGAVINDTLTYLESGIHCLGCVSYIVKAYNDTGLNTLNFTTCLNTAVTINFHVMRASAPLSVSAISNPNILLIYPNPTNDIFTIKSISSKDKTLVEIMNVVGEIVYSEKLFGKNEYLIDANFTKGIYFVRVSDGEINAVRKLVVE